MYIIIFLYSNIILNTFKEKKIEYVFSIIVCIFYLTNKIFKKTSLKILRKKIVLF